MVNKSKLILLILAAIISLGIIGTTRAADCTAPTLVAEGDDPSVSWPYIAFQGYANVDGIMKQELQYHHIPSGITSGTGLFYPEGQNAEVSGSTIAFAGGYYDIENDIATVTEGVGHLPSISGSIIAYGGWEDEDWNNNGREDDAVRIYSTESSSVMNEHVIGGWNPEISGNTVVMYVFEWMRPEDLNEDGVLNDIIVSYYDLRETEQYLISTGMNGWSVGVSGDTIAFAANEGDDERDWNNDGDERDNVIFYCDVSTEISVPVIANMVDDYVADGAIDNAGIGEALRVI